MNTATRTLAIAFAALALTAGSAPAAAQAHHGSHGSGHSWHGHGHGHHRFHDRWGVGIGIGLGWGYPIGYPGYVVVEPSVVYDPLPAAPSPADPVFDPRSGQSAAQTEADRQDCNRWATTQPSAMADAGVFHRAVLGCMEGRGYSVR